jgi:phosphoribosylanthranilate isomerase
MSLWVKICGNTSLVDARLAVEAGADALGFVFAPGPRRVTPEQVAEIVAGLSDVDAVERIGVFVEADLATISRHVDQCGLTGVQLHSSNQPGVIAGLRERFGAGLRILGVIHFGGDAEEQLRSVKNESGVDGVLVDSRTATALGGTGIAFDWVTARSTVFKPEAGLRLVAAGGLNPLNVSDAIRTLEPWGVDVVTGVEAAPGRKDSAKVRAFVAAARAVSRTTT